MRNDVCLIESLFKRGVGDILSDVIARLGEGILPKRDNVALLLI